MDYFFALSADRFRIKNSQIVILSDHSPITLIVDLERDMKRTLWKLNSFILTDPRTVEKPTGEINEYLKFNDDGIIKPTILWDALKVGLRGKIISLTAYMKSVGENSLQTCRQS